MSKRFREDNSQQLYGNKDHGNEAPTDLHMISEHPRQAERAAVRMTERAERALSNSEACASHPGHTLPENPFGKAFFIRKPSNIAECRQCITRAKTRGVFESGQADYQILLRRTLDGKEWRDLTEGFLVDRSWLDALNRKVEALHDPSPDVFYCMQVNVRGRPGSLLIATSGYIYARYVALVD